MRSLTACLALVLLGLTACAEAESPSGLKSAADQSAAKPQSPGAAPSRAPSAAPESEMQPVSLQTAGGAQAAAEAFERKIIRNADITVELENPEGAKQRLSSIAESSGGFIVTSESQQRGDSGMHITVTMRVPAAQFGPAVDSIRSMGGRILQDKVTGQDVTEEYIDLQARIRTKQALEAQFLEIMKQARSISDALEVQRQIAGVRTEIEQLEGRRRFLENQSSLSTIIVRLQPPTAITSVTGGSLGADIKDAFSDSVDIALTIVLGFVRALGFLIPVGLLLGLPAFLLFRFLIRRLSPASRAPQS